MALDRDLAVKLCRMYFPECGGDPNHPVAVTQGQIIFEHIARDYGGKGTTCGFLPHWMLWRLGGTDPALICRTEPDKFRYRHGNNISDISGYKPAWQALDSHKTGDFESGRTYPGPGDIVIIKGRDYKTYTDVVDKKGVSKRVYTGSEHIFVILSAPLILNGTATWEIANTGQSIRWGNSENHKREGGYIATMNVTKGPVDVGKGAGPQVNDHYESTFKIGERKILGWLSLDSVPGGAPVGLWADSALVKVKYFLSDQLVNSRVQGVWTSSEQTDRVCLLKKGHRAYRFTRPEPSAHATFAEDGFWWAGADALGGDVTVIWSSDSESWTFDKAALGPAGSFSKAMVRLRNGGVFAQEHIFHPPASLGLAHWLQQP